MNAMLPNEEIPAAPDAIRIRLEGRCDPIRPIRRLLVAVRCPDDHDSAICEAARIPRGEERIVEMYVDRLPRVLARTRTDEHRRALAQAQQIAKTKNEAWMKAEHRKVEAMRARPPAEFAKWLSNSQPAASCGSQELAMLGYPGGVPPLESVEVVHPTDPSAPRIDGFAFVQLPEAERVAYTIKPPPTAASAAHDATAYLAEQIAAAIKGKGK